MRGNDRKGIPWGSWLIQGLALVVLACCAGALFFTLGPIVADFAADLAVFVGLIAGGVFLIGAHGVTVWWLWTHPLPRWRGWVQWIAGQLPFLITYPLTYQWYFGTFERWKEPSLWVLPWVFAASAAVVGLLVWWLHGELRNPRRALALIAGLAVLAAANVAGVLKVEFDSGYSGGLVGEENPRDAFGAAAALSCLNGIGGDWYHRRGELVEADCPSGNTAGNRYRPDGGHDPELASVLDGDQPWQTFRRWWQLQHDYHYFTLIDFTAEEPEVTGDTASLAVVAELRVHNIAPGQPRFKIDQDREVWLVTLTRATLGGWKISHIEVPDPIEITPAD